MDYAIFTNTLEHLGGAEYVALKTAEILDAKIYTTNTNPDILKRHHQIDIESIGNVPTQPPFRQQMINQKFKKLDVTQKHDFFINMSDWSMPSMKKHKPNLAYIHSPTRELFDLYEWTKKNTIPIYELSIFEIWAKYNKKKYVEYTQHAEKLVANSLNTAQRIEKYLAKKSEIIYPPVETQKFKYKKPQGYWLSVNRIIPQKRIETQINAFNRLPDEKLVIVGSAENSTHQQKYLKKLNSLKSENVLFMHDVSETDLIRLYSNSNGLIATALDEDFGLTPVEAMASGKPVIASNAGGYKETVTEETGILLNETNPKNIIFAIQKIKEHLPDYRKPCQKQAEKFDIKKYEEKLRTTITENQNPIYQ